MARCMMMAYGDEKGQCFAGTGLGGTQHILALKQHHKSREIHSWCTHLEALGQCLQLDVSGRDVPCGAQTCNESQSINSSNELINLLVEPS